MAQNHGKSRDQLKAFLSAEQKTHLDEQVAAGRMTQAQADAKLAEFSANLDTRIDQVGKPARGMQPGGAN